MSIGQTGVFDYMPGFVAILSGPGHRFDYVNEAYRRISGPRDFVGRDVRDVFPELKGQGFFELLDSVYATGEAYAARSIPIVLDRDDGERFIDLLYNPIRDPAGAITGIFVSGYDTTEVNRAQQRWRALAEFNDKLAAIEDVEQLPHEAAEILGRMLNVSRVGYGTIDDDAATLHVVRDWTMPGVETLAGETPLLEYGSFIDSLRRNEFVVIEDVRLDPRTAMAAASLEQRSARSFVNVPVVEKGRLVAVLFLNHATVRHWRSDELALVKEIAERVRGALQRDRDAKARRRIEVSYKTLFEALDAGFCVVEMKYDDDGRAIDYRLAEINPAFEQQTGLHGAAGKWVSEAAPGLEQHWFDTYGRVGLTGEAVRFENHAAPFGRWYDVHAFRTGAPDEHRVAILFNDITESRVAQNRLRELNETLETRVTERTAERNRVWTMSRDLFAVMGFDGFLKEINPAWETTLGRDTGTLLAMPFPDQVHPDDQASVAGVIEQLRAGRTIEKFEGRLRHADGSWRWISWTLVPAADNFYAVGRDVTEEKQRDVQLAARTAERNRLWDLSQDMFARANLEGMMSAVSPAWTRVLGWSEDELLSRPYATFMHPDDMAPTLAALAGMGETGQPVRFENRIATSDGSWKWIEWTAAPELGGQNFIAVGRDLSYVKARETELLAAQDALRQAQKMEAVGQLTGGLAHDFNNILAGIGGSLELMSTRLAQGRTAELDRYITGATGATKRAAALTQRLLAFSRRQTLEPKPTDLAGLVNGMLDLINRSMGPTVDVEAINAAGLWATFVDAGQLENALLNLCINARDAMPDGGKLTIETSNRWIDDRNGRQHDLAPGQYVSMCVSDTGTGMSPDVIERAFDPFFTTKPIGEGTGLGLSMVYGFAGQSGGTVRIYSEVGQGTNVCIYLPRHQGEVHPDADALAPESLPRAEESETVLLVDDEPLVRMIATEALEELGYAVIEAGDGASALKTLSSTQRIDLLITDVGLPGGMNGRQVADAARMHRPGLKVLFITGYAENAVLNHGHLAAGMQVLTKPFQIDTFARRVRELIQKN
jgi:PAS domain S-box-containing protein